jgi:hypothetical protein
MKINFFLAVLIFVGGFYQMPAWASSDSSGESEEVSYDQLVRELNSRVSKQQRHWVQTNSVDPFDTLKIHFSLGFIQSINTLSINDRTFSRFEDGLQLGVGIDLFSTEWVAEGVLKNFGQSKTDEGTLALREFDLRLAYLQQAPQSRMKFRFANGLGARYLRYNGLLSNGNQFQTTPVYSMGIGMLVPVGSHFDIDFEIQSHLSLISDSVDKHGLALVVKLNNVF